MHNEVVERHYMECALWMYILCPPPPPRPPRLNTTSHGSMDCGWPSHGNPQRSVDCGCISPLGGTASPL